MHKFEQVGGYIINPANIAYIEDWLGPDGLSKGCRIVFNSYAAAATAIDFGYEALSIEIFGIEGIKLMDFLNMRLKCSTAQNVIMK